MLRSLPDPTTSMPSSSKTNAGQIMILGEWPDGSANSTGGPRRFNRRLCESIELSEAQVVNPRRRAAAKSRIGQVGAIVKAALTSRPSIVHVTTDGFHVVGALACKLLFRSRIVYSIHSLIRVWPEITRCTPRVDRVRRRLMEWSMVRWADCAVFPSVQYLRAAEATGYRFRRTETVYHGCDARTDRTQRHQPAAPLRFSVFGPALRVKGVERVPGILSELCGLGTLHWVGCDGSDPFQRTDILTQSQLENPALHLSPPVPPDMVENELSESAICLMPSLQESFGIVALESAAAGVPVAVSASTGIAEIIVAAHCGAVVDFERRGSLRAAVETILADYESYSAAGIACARRYTWARAAASYFRIYRSLGISIKTDAGHLEPESDPLDCHHQ